MINYLHKTLKQLLIDVYNNRREEFLKFFGIEQDYVLSDMDFEELNPVGIAAQLISEVEEMDAKTL